MTREAIVKEGSLRSEFLEGRSWQVADSLVEDAPAGMLSMEEKTMLFLMARDGYEGIGEVIDAGAFLGASSFCLAKGLSASRPARSIAGRLHAYDLFTVWREPGSSERFVASELKSNFGLNIGNRESTLPVFMQNLGPYGDLVRVHVGDFRDELWPGRPIELLFVDVCKSLTIWQHMLRHFFPSLIPERSVVIHQDYHHPLLPFIHVVHEFLSPYFTILDKKVHDSLVLRLADRIPDADLRRAADYDFTVAQELKLMDGAIARMGGHGRHLVLAKAQLLAMRGRLEEAWTALEPIDAFVRSGNCSDEMLVLYVGMTKENLAKFEAQRSAPPASFSEAEYLGLYPDVREAVESGRFDSGFEHWIGYGCSEGRVSSLEQQSDQDPRGHPFP